MYNYKVAEVLRVVDGDTLDLKVDLGFKTFMEMRFRLIGVDTPEIFRPKSDEEYKLGILAKKFVEDALSEAIDIHIQSEKDIGVYGRWACSIFYKTIDGQGKISEEMNLSEQLELEKLTKKYI